MVRGDQNADGDDGPNTGNKSFDRKSKKHSEAIKDFSVRTKSGINDGIVYDRSCNDILWLGIFTLAFLGMFGLAVYSVSTGDVNKLIAPYDAAGHLCGYDKDEVSGKDFTQNKHLYFTKVLNQLGEFKFDEFQRSGVCVKSCPKVEDVTSQTWWDANCLDANLETPCPKARTEGSTSIVPYTSTEVLTYCVPNWANGTDEEQKWFKQMTENFFGDEAGKLIMEMTNTWKTTLSLVFTGLICSTLFMYLMSKCARCMAMTGIAVLLLSFFGGGAFAIFTGMNNEMDTGLMIAGGVMILFGLCTVCVIWCNRTSLETAIAIIDASADFMIDTKRLVLVSILYFFITMIFFFLWLGATACLFAMVPFTNTDPGSQVKDFLPGNAHWGMAGFMLFGLLWTIQLLNDQAKYITMVSASTYYFDSNAQKDGSASVSTAFSFAYGKNLGSLCFGSLILTLIAILRAIVESLASGASEDGDGAAKALACVAKCCMACLESLIDHLSKLAYAYMAVSGDSLCTSAWNGFLLNLKHLAKFIFALKIAGLFILMGILSITCVNTGIGYVLTKFVIKDAVKDPTGGVVEPLDSLIPSLIVFAVVSLIVACIFLGQFDEAVLSTLICFAVDSDLHDGEPKFGPKSYHDKLRAIYGDDDNDKVHDELKQPLNGNQPNQQNQMY